MTQEITTASEYSRKPEAYFNYARREMLDFIPAGVTSVLEIGCGSGAFGALVKQSRGCRYTGVELVESEANVARTRLDCVVLANIERDALPFSSGEFDCLVCNDVLEHLTDPWAALKKLVSLLQPGGHVVISIPNVRFSEVVKGLLFRDEWVYQSQGVLDRTHLRFFTKKTVVDLLESAGTEVIELRGINGIEYAWRLKILNLMLLGALSSMRYPQYGACARVRGHLGTGSTQLR